MELYASASAVISSVREQLALGVTSSLSREDREIEELSLEDIAEAAQSHDRLCEKVLLEAGAYLGIAVGSVVNLLDPERIILAGKVPQAGIFCSSLVQELRYRALPQLAKGLDVVVSQFGEEYAAVGAAMVCGEDVLEARCEETDRENVAYRRAETATSTDSESRTG